ncbi:MAG TPA: preprotein translocase subunit SecG [Candidatus Paceibacterota bacterium]|nr:preprotein translocase subunit SecG [Candidatus Paceibacterota bacterium]
MNPTTLSYIQIVLSVVLTALILLQYSEAGAGSAFGGGDNFNSGFHTRRGFEKTVFFATIICGVLFAVSAFVALIIK